VRRLLAVPVVALLTGCSTPLTADRVGPSFAEVFAGLYAAQQTALGRTDVTVSGTAAACRRTGTSPDGPGEDWSCTVQYVDAGAAAAQTFEVQVKPDGCWKAEGPPAAQPAELVDAATGTRSTNPLSEFDGCLDTSWR
jgi:hypothetical protein